MSKGVEKLKDEYQRYKWGSNPEVREMLADIGCAFFIPINDDYLHWAGVINGPKNSPYENGRYFFEMKFTNNYPNEGPIDVRMKTPIYHPNINNLDGHICLHYLYKWKNTYNIAGIALAIYELLFYPNPASSYKPINISKAKEFNKKYAYSQGFDSIDWNNSWDKGWNL